MNQEEREALTQKTTQSILSCLQHTTNAEEAIRSQLNKYSLGMFATGGRNSEEWISRTLAGLPIPIFITRTQPEGEGGKEPVLAYHWQTLNKEGDGVTFAYGLEQVLTHLMHQQRPS